MRELERYKLAIEKSNSVVYEWDIDRDSFTWSGDIQKLLHLNAETQIANKADLLELIRAEDRIKVGSSMQLAAKNAGDYQRHFQAIGLDNELISIIDRGTYIMQKNKRSLVGMMQPNPFGNHIQEDEPSIQSLQDLFIFSRFQTDTFRRELAEVFFKDLDSNHHSVLLKISIDNLSMLISWYSTGFANRIMEHLEGELKRILRPTDVIYRLGLDQFGVLLVNHSQGEAELVIDRLLQTIHLYTNKSFKDPFHLRCSMGSVYISDDVNSVEDALNKSYIALSCAKSKQNEFYIDYKQAQSEHMTNRKEVAQVNSVQNAINENRLQLAFQPIIHSHSGEIYSHECLLRMRDESGNVQSAGALIPIAEKLGMIEMIDFFVMERVIEELEAYPEMRLGFNVSNLTTDNPRWLRSFSQLLKKPEIAERIVVEITETAANHDMRQTAYFVAALQNLGCQVALDDFGAGYTSFRQLKTLSLDMVKIDGAYIIGLEENSENLLFIKTLVEFNRSYGLSTVAECVESGEVAKILMDAGVDFLQGYYFGVPTLTPPWREEPVTLQSIQP